MQDVFDRSAARLDAVLLLGAMRRTLSDDREPTQSILTMRPFVAGRKVSTGFLLIIVLLLLLLITPLVILPFASLSRDQLSDISNIGQAYGSISALLSALALASVAASLFYQARQDRAHRIDALRQGQQQLLAYVIAEPSVFGPCIVDFARLESDEDARRYFFTTLWLNYCRQGYEIGVFDENHIRAEFAEGMFESEVAARLWGVRMAELQRQGVKDIGSFNRIFARESDRRAGSASRGGVATGSSESTQESSEQSSGDQGQVGVRAEGDLDG
ncbi:DUF6082 family protein [Actinoplanes sp. Pm04-4]|uniref:DUF6082 family protein n=1 Tax=Paractinoplanes pyxinae TaxID=2997416 RepID=A0ABT4AYH6_9ACTN|nr:DUF6082 family protein [Actinoplanes pyxinae]MCY1139291.1 DUF6082 family protein [Actinoplanes pyxinae]